MSPAGRPREFDEDQVLDRAVQQFWTRGYEATSMADLIESTGLHKGSLYKAFGEKHALFMTALARYLDMALTMTREQLAGAESPAAGLEAWLHGVVERQKSGARRCGCFAVNAAVELAPRDEVVRRRLRRHDREMIGLMRDAIERGQRAGQFRSDRGAEELAEYVLTLVSGLSAGARRDAQIARGERLVDLAMETLRA
jgi:TetR/AcrR family transcriptional repressor of nem operon